MSALDESFLVFSREVVSVEFTEVSVWKEEDFSRVLPS